MYKNLFLCIKRNVPVYFIDIINFNTFSVAPSIINENLRLFIDEIVELLNLDGSYECSYWNNSVFDSWGLVGLVSWKRPFLRELKIECSSKHFNKTYKDFNYKNSSCKIYKCHMITVFSVINKVIYRKNLFKKSFNQYYPYYVS